MVAMTSRHELHSFTMLTINATEHPLMRNFHKPADEKRIVVILREGGYNDWLCAPPSSSKKFMHPFPAKRMVASAQSNP